MRVIKYLRQESGLSQAELAALIGTTQPAIADWENGKRSMRRDKAKAAIAHIRRLVHWPVTVDELEIDLLTYIARRLVGGKPYGPQR